MSDLTKYNVSMWERIANQLLSAIKSPLTLAVFTATCIEMPDGTANIIAHLDGHEMAVRKMANALYRTYGDGAYALGDATAQVSAKPANTLNLN